MQRGGPATPALRFYLDPQPGRCGLKPGPVIVLGPAGQGALRLRHRVRPRGGRRLSLVGADGSEHKLAPVTHWQSFPASDEPFELRNMGRSRSFVSLQTGAGTAVCACPHRNRALEMVPRAPGTLVLYLQVPRGVTSFYLEVIGATGALRLLDGRGREVKFTPSNPVPYLASAARCRNGSASVSESRARVLQLHVPHDGQSFTIGTRERLPVFLHKPVRLLPLAQVRLTTLDGGGNFLPCRVSFMRQTAWWGAVYTRRPATLVAMPPGSYTFQADHGLEYLPDRHDVRVSEGTRLNETFVVRRGLEADRGWYGGDCHTHTTVSDGGATVADMHHAARCNGLDWMAFTDHANRSYKHTWGYGRREVEQLAEDDVIGLPGLETSTCDPENHYNAINVRHYVHPEHEAEEAGTGEVHYKPKSVKEIHDEVMNQDSPRRPVMCVLNHPMHSACKGPEVLRASDRFSVFEVSTGNHAPNVKRRILDLWFGLLNRGRRLSGVAGTDTHHFDFYPPGSERVYCYVRGRPTRNKIVRALREGRSFCTWGPTLIFLSVNGKRPGEAVGSSRFPATLHVVVRAQSLLPLSRLDVVCNGKVVRALEAGKHVAATADDWVYPAVLNTVTHYASGFDMTVNRPCWMVLLAYLEGKTGHTAVTNPVYVERGRGARV